MTLQKRWMSFLLSVFFVITILSIESAQAANSVTLYTPYTKISVTPGQSIDYSIDVINNSSDMQKVDISLSGMPRGWTYALKSGGWNISQLSILPGERKNLSLKVEVPYQVNKGNYQFKINAGEISSLPLVVNVSEKGTYETEFTSDQPNMQGHSGSTFSFKARLQNRTGEKQMYALMADAERGWNVTFKANYQQATSVELEPNSTKDINIDIISPSQIEAGTYKIPVRAVTNSTSAKLEIEMVVTGTYSMELTTPTGLLSTNITAGEDKKLDLVIRNTGSSELTNIDLRSSTPAKWEVTFDPKKVDKLLPGNEARVTVTMKADKKAIPGDYVTNIDAKTTDVSSKIAFRISVKTPMLWGWIGILIIIIAFGGVFYLFRKFGRR